MIVAWMFSTGVADDMLIWERRGGEGGGRGRAIVYIPPGGRLEPAEAASHEPALTSSQRTGPGCGACPALDARLFAFAASAPLIQTLRQLPGCCHDGTVHLTSYLREYISTIDIAI